MLGWSRSLLRGLLILSLSVGSGLSVTRHANAESTPETGVHTSSRISDVEKINILMEEEVMESPRATSSQQSGCLLYLIRLPPLIDKSTAQQALLKSRKAGYASFTLPSEASNRVVLDWAFTRQKALLTAADLMEKLGQEILVQCVCARRFDS